jgi:uncharacterized membrane protein YczE
MKAGLTAGSWEIIIAFILIFCHSFLKPFYVEWFLISFFCPAFLYNKKKLPKMAA